MKLLNEVKDKLEKKGYCFDEDLWTSQELTLLYDVVYATEKIIKTKIKKALK
jgi:hypothetical protein